MAPNHRQPPQRRQRAEEGAHRRWSRCGVGLLAEQDAENHQLE